MADFSIISIVLILIIAFIAGMDGVLDEFQFHQPLVSCTLIGLAAGQPIPGIMLGGTLQMLALGWANIGAAVAPDVALASTAATVILLKSGDFSQNGITVAYGAAIPLAVAGLALTMVVRTISVGIAHSADAAAKNGNFKGVERAHILALCLQGLRIAVPVGLLIALPSQTVQNLLGAIPEKFSDGMTIGGAMVVAVGYALVINMMASREVWPFFALGFVVAALSELTLIAIGAIGVALALIYLNLSKKGGGAGSAAAASGSGDPIGDILEDY